MYENPPASMPDLGGGSISLRRINIVEQREMRFVRAEGAENLEMRIRLIMKANDIKLNDFQKRLGYTRQYMWRLLKDGATLLRLGMLYQVMDAMEYDVLVKITRKDLTELPKNGLPLSEMIQQETENGERVVIKEVAELRVVSFVELVNKLGYKVYFSFVQRETGEIM